VLPAPVPLRPFLQFAKLPARAVDAARRAVDSDEEFRARVAEVVSEEDVGRAGWLWLTRPPDWESELEELQREVAGAGEAAAERRAENEARRRLAGAEAATQRAEAAAAAAQADSARAAAALADERRARRTAAQEAEDLARRLQHVTAERDRARADRDRAAQDATSARQRASEVKATLKELRSRPPPPGRPATGTPATGTPTTGTPTTGTPTSPAPTTGTPAGTRPAAAPVAADPSGPPVATTTGPVPEGGVDAAATALLAAASAAARMATALEAAAIGLGARRTPPAGAGRDPVLPATRVAPAAATRPGRRPRPPRRIPVALPPGIHDDSVEAADHLVRVAGMVVLVDGYNVSQTGWPELAMSEQRRRLVDALTELATRSGADVSVVFDGAEPLWPAVVPATSRLVRVSFSPADVEADDVLLARVADLDVSRPVLVASSDRRVQDGAAGMGANVISSAQLLAALRR
jgi:predicted RNA-binding protein with PIN domain